MVRYLITGCGTSLLDLLLFSLFALLLRAPEVLANIASTVITVCVSYLINRVFVFYAETATWRTFFSFAGITLATGLVLQSAIIWGLVRIVEAIALPFSELLALPLIKMCAMLVGAICNYLGYRLIFQGKAVSESVQNSSGGLARSGLRELVRGSSRKFAFTGVFALVFTGVDVLAQAASGEIVTWTAVSASRTGLMLIGSLLITWLLLGLLDAKATTATAVHAPTILPRTKLPWVAFAMLLVGWLLQYAYYYPLASINDTYYLMIAPLSSSVQHPLIYNWIVAGIAAASEALTGKILVGVITLSLLQMVAWGAACAYLISVLERRRISRIVLWILILYLAAYPIVGNYSFAQVKDAAFGIFVVLLIPTLIKIWETRGKILQSLGFFIGAVGVFVGFAIMRNNGLVAVVPLLILTIILACRYWQRVLTFAAIAIVISLIPSVISSICAGEQRFVESVGIPLQMVGYAIAHNPSCLPEEDAAYFDEYLDLSRWAEAYDPESVDAIKDHAYSRNSWLQRNRDTFLQHFTSVAIACPAEVTAGYLVHTDDLWRIDAGTTGTHTQSYFTEAVSNYPSARYELIEEYAEKGVANTSLLPEFVEATLGKYFDWNLRNTPGAGTWMWVGALAVVGFAYRKRHEWIGVCLPMLLIWGTLMAAAPTVQPFRYVQALVVVVPVLWVLLLGVRSRREEVVRVEAESEAEDVKEAESVKNERVKTEHGEGGVSKRSASAPKIDASVPK